MHGTGQEQRSLEPGLITLVTGESLPSLTPRPTQVGTRVFYLE